jgi:hypothetical protein
MDHHDALFQVRAREASRALCLDGERLCAVLHADPELAAEVLRRTLKLVAGRLQATEARLGEMCGVRMGLEAVAAHRCPPFRRTVYYRVGPFVRVPGRIGGCPAS